MNIATAFRRLVTFPMCLLYVALVVYSRRKTYWAGIRSRLRITRSETPRHSHPSGGMRHA